MKKHILLLIFVSLVSITAGAQTLYEEFVSKKLDTTRRIKIQLPRNYEDNIDKVYPIVLVFDGDYLFEPVAGNVDYFSYWEDMPESIVVGIMQGNERYNDAYYDELSYMPAESGAAFFEFIGLELVPYLDNNFRTAKFIIAVGHDYTANYLNYYLFKDPPLFNGYISLSPDIAPEMDNRLQQRIPSVDQKIFYYMATGTDDIKALAEGTEALDKVLQPLKSDNFLYHYDNFEGATHYSLVGRGIPNALEKIFSVYRPISKKQFNDVLMKTTTPINEYLTEKYRIIEDLFGLTNPIRVNDYIACASAAEKRKQWDALREIATMAQKDYPDTVLGDYYMGRYFEETGEPKKAMRTFQGAFNKEEVDFITVDTMLDKADRIKEDFGY